MPIEKVTLTPTDKVSLNSKRLLVQGTLHNLSLWPT